MVAMSRIKKMVLIIALSIGMVLCFLGIILIYNNPKTYTEEIALFDYTFQPNLSYEVHLIDNVLYDTIQKEGAIYIKNILDYIKVDFGINYQASESIPLNMEYVVNASVVGFSSSNNNRLDYWRKDFPLTENKQLYMVTDIVQESLSHQLKLDSYENFAVDANKLTGVNLSTELIISMMGCITATTSEGEKLTPFDINMTIPLQENLIEISKGSLEPISERFTESIVHTLPIEIKYIVLLSVLILVLIVGLLLAIFRIYEPTQKEILKNEVKKIINNHGSRMIALQCSPSNKSIHTTYEVASIKDLIILSDDINKPIYYIKDDKEVAMDSSFYVDDKGELYIYTHRTAYNKNFYLRESVNIDDMLDSKQNDENESPACQIPNS